MYDLYTVHGICTVQLWGRVLHSCSICEIATDLLTWATDKETRRQDEIPNKNIYMFLPNCCCTCEIVTALVSHGSLTSLSAPPWLGLDAVGLKDDDDYLTGAPMNMSWVLSVLNVEHWNWALWISWCLNWISISIYSNALVSRAQI